MKNGKNVLTSSEDHIINISTYDLVPSHFLKFVRGRP